MRVPIASPAVQSDILHSVCTRQVLRGEFGASERSGDCGGLKTSPESQTLLRELLIKYNIRFLDKTV